MKNVIKKIIRSVVAKFGTTLVGRYLYREVMASALARTQKVHHAGVDLVFCTPTELNIYRASSFSTKEPETLEWIDAMPRGAVVWDVGANVGLYSCYAAKHRDCRVFAFEPSVFNLELLARNVFNNDLVGKVTIVPLPLSENLAINTLNMSSMEWGGALSSFGQGFGHDGKTLQSIFRFSTVGLSMQDAVEYLKIPTPDYIKMDVDGIEHLILKGGASVLSGVRGVLIEINDEFPEQYNRAADFLKSAGLVMLEKRQSAEVQQNRMFGSSFNQIWGRANAANSALLSN